MTNDEEFALSRTRSNFVILSSFGIHASSFPLHKLSNSSLLVICAGMFFA
jgi:hypothetical protein